MEFVEVLLYMMHIVYAYLECNVVFLHGLAY